MSHNLHRRSLTASQRAIVAARLRGIYDEAAKERKVEAGKQTGRGNKKVPEKLPEPLDARDAAGAAVGVSGKTVDNLRRVDVGNFRHGEALNVSGKSVSTIVDIQPIDAATKNDRVVSRYKRSEQLGRVSSRRTKGRVREAYRRPEKSACQ